MLSFLAPYKYAMLAALLFALTAGGILVVRAHDAGQQRIGEDRAMAKWAVATAAAKDAQHVREAKFQKEKDDAETQSAIRIAQARAAASHALDANRVLDSTLAALVARSATDTVEANRKYITALGKVFGDCTARYREMGVLAQGHADDALKFEQAFPQ